MTARTPISAFRWPGECALGAKRAVAQSVGPTTLTSTAPPLSITLNYRAGSSDREHPRDRSGTAYPRTAFRTEPSTKSTCGTAHLPPCGTRQARHSVSARMIDFIMVAAPVQCGAECTMRIRAAGHRGQVTPSLDMRHRVTIVAISTTTTHGYAAICNKGIPGATHFTPPARSAEDGGAGSVASSPLR